MSLVCVNDIILPSDYLEDINYVKGISKKVFRIKDLDKLKLFLGLEVSRITEGIHLCQWKYCLDILFDYGMLVVRPYCTPITKDIKHMYRKNSYIS